MLEFVGHIMEKVWSMMSVVEDVDAVKLFVVNFDCTISCLKIKQIKNNFSKISFQSTGTIKFNLIVFKL